MRIITHNIKVKSAFTRVKLGKSTGLYDVVVEMLKALVCDISHTYMPVTNFQAIKRNYRCYLYFQTGTGQIFGTRNCGWLLSTLKRRLSK